MNPVDISHHCRFVRPFASVAEWSQYLLGQQTGFESWFGHLSRVCMYYRINFLTGHSTIWPVCAESAVNTPTNQPVTLHEN